MTPDTPPAGSAERHHLVKALFLAAIELPAGRRMAHLSEACGGDEPLLREVLELLLLHGAKDTVLDAPMSPFETLAVLTATSEMAGPWRLIRELGRGGMGVVHLAEHLDGRVAALKLLSSSIVSAETRERFRLEADILTRLDHPGVAHVYEVGERERSAGDRQPWIAMEYIDGRSLLADAERRGLDLRARIEQLAAVCDAVRHAHEHGIVHRDLKPSNIIVRADGRPVVLDFGVARLIAGDERPTELATRIGQLVGTPQYMSPEQVQAEPDSIGPPSDVYSLGVIAYEMLSGALPYEASSVSLHRAVVSILTLEPAPLGQVAPALRGPLERIIAMALEKHATDRYGDAGALGDDLRRFLAGRTVQARGPDIGRRIARWSRRRRRTALALAAIALIATIGGSWWIGGSRLMPRAEVVARYRQAEMLTYDGVALVYEGERTPEKLRTAIDNTERARALIADIPRLRHYPLLLRQIDKQLGTSQMLLADMTWDIALARSAISVLSEASRLEIDTSGGWQQDRQIPQLSLDVNAGDLIGLAGGAFHVTYRLRGERAAVAATLELAKGGYSELTARFGPAPPASSLDPLHSNDEPFAYGYNDLAQAWTDYARYGNSPAHARQALLYSDSAYARQVAFIHNWPAFGSLLFERARAFRTCAEAEGRPELLDSAIVCLVACELYRGPQRARVFAETREERAGVWLALARLATEPDRRMKLLRAATADVDSARIVLGSVAAGTPPIAALHSLEAEIWAERAVAARAPAALDSADAHIAAAERGLPPSDLPHPAGLVLVRRGIVEGARARLGSPGSWPAAFGALDRAVALAYAPRADSQVIILANRARLELMAARGR